MSTSAQHYWTCQCGVQVPMGCSHTCAHIGPTPGREITVNPQWPFATIAALTARAEAAEAENQRLRAAPPGDLVGALRAALNALHECRDALAAGVVGETCTGTDCPGCNRGRRVDRAITRAAAALASAERPGGDDG